MLLPAVTCIDVACSRARFFPCNLWLGWEHEVQIRGLPLQFRGVLFKVLSVAEEASPVCGVVIRPASSAPCQVSAASSELQKLKRF